MTMTESVQTAPVDFFSLAGSAEIQKDASLGLLVAQLILDLILHSTWAWETCDLLHASNDEG